MTTLRLEEAVERANAKLRELSGSDPDGLMITRAELPDNDWLFFYRNTAYVQSRSFLDLLGGDLPILITPDGAVMIVAYDDIDDRAGTPI